MKNNKILLFGLIFVIVVSFAFLSKGTQSNELSQDQYEFHFGVDVSESLKQINHIYASTTVKELKSKVKLGDDLRVDVVSTDGRSKTDNLLIATGDKLIIYKNNTKLNEYSLSVYGDSSGDGIVDIIDLVQIRKHIVGYMENGKQYKKTGVYFNGMDLDNNSIIDLIDLVKMRKFIVAIDPYSIKLNKNVVQLVVGETAELDFSLSPEKVINNNVKWGSYKQSIAKVNDGIVTAVKEGETYIAVKTENELISYCYVIILPSPEVTEYKVTLKSNGSNSKDKVLSCQVKNGLCEIELPKIDTEYEALGWGVSSDLHAPTYGQGEKITLTKDLTLYAISKRTFHAKFDTSSIDYISFDETSCDAYNGADSCTITLPYFNKKGHHSTYWSTDSITMTDMHANNVVKKDEYFLTVLTSYTIKKDMTFYPNFNFYDYESFSEDSKYRKYRNFDLFDTYLMGKTIIDVEDGIPDDIINNFLDKMNIIQEDYPFLFHAGKMFVLTEETYKNYSRAYAVTYGPYIFFQIDLFYDPDHEDSVNGAISINGALHELSHAWDRYYDPMTGTRLSETEEFKEIHKSLEKKLTDSDGEILSLSETFASLFTNYYWHILGNDDSKEWYGMSAALDDKESETVAKFFEKHFAFSKNGYK